MSKEKTLNLPERFKIHYDILGLPFNSSEEKIKKAFMTIQLQYDNGLIDIDKYYEVKKRYTELMEDLQARNEDKKEEQACKKRQLQLLTEEMKREQRKRKELEDYKGPLWTMIEYLKENPPKGNTTEILAIVKENILPLLDESHQEIYCHFLERFRQLWDQLYEEFCKYEQMMLKDNRIDIDSVFSIGIDELTNKTLKECSDYDNYEDLFLYEKKLTEQIPDNSNYYFLEAHLDIVTKNLSIDYEKSDFIVRIYSFMVNSRILKLKNQYHNERFKLEKDQEITGVVYIDPKEIISYIQEKLCTYDQPQQPLKK